VVGIWELAAIIITAWEDFESFVGTILLFSKPERVFPSSMGTRLVHQKPMSLAIRRPT
jgi:hypothetical protein